MTKPRLHLDADTSKKAVQKALLERGFDVTRTPNEWMPLEASDEQQFLGAIAQGRIIFTYNIRDFLFLAKRFPSHAGLILSAQRSLKLGEVIGALDRVLSETKAEEWIGQVRWLNDWRK
jgi:hypothetical protein